jgi:O-antigen/teichoic acid export membrane protein
MPNTDSTPSLGLRTVTGAGWVIVWRMSTRLLGVINTVVLVRLLSALVAMLKVIAYFSGVLLNAHGLIHIQFRIAVAALVGRLVLLFALIGPFGLMGAAAGAIGGIALEEVLYLIVCFRRFSLKTMDLLRGTWRCFVATGVMGARWCGAGSARSRR